MAEPATTRIAVTVENKRRMILAIRERNSGDLIVTTPGTGNKARDAGIPTKSPGRSPSHNVLITSQKFSIHTSDASATHNQLHFRQDVAQGEPLDFYHVTRAVKSGTFAPLFIKRLTALRDPVYDPKKATRVRTLDTFDNNKFNMVMFVLVGGPDSKFRARASDLNVTQLSFSRFGLTILWSYFLPASNDFSYMSTFMTIDPQHAGDAPEKAALERWMEGVDSNQALDLFLLLRSNLREEALVTAARWVPEFYEKEKATFEKLARAPFFRTGHMTNKIRKALRKQFPNGL